MVETTVSRDLILLSPVLKPAGLVRGLQKYSGQIIRSRSSSPKLQVYNNALKSALLDTDFRQVRDDSAKWGRFVESAAGAHLLNSAVQDDIPIYYWRSGDYEVDFVVKHKGELIGFEVKSGGRVRSSEGLSAFLKHYPESRPIIIGTGGIPLEEFFLKPLAEWF